MPLSYSELERFYEGLVIRLRQSGAHCAITSGMACVAYGVAQTTKDCDMLCSPTGARELLAILDQAGIQGVLPLYRGHITPPLDQRWLSGGWTSHFVWHVPNSEAYLDVFGVAPRASSRWDVELQNFYCSPNIVAEMKRTDRDRDWAYATALGVKLLEAGDSRGWLHIFDYDVLTAVAQRLTCPPEVMEHRPVLRLLTSGDEKLEVALKGEIEFWHRLDRGRLRIYERAVRPYMVAVKKDVRCDAPTLSVQHQARVDHAEELLPHNPLRDYGLERLIAEAKEQAARFLPAGALQCLPDARRHFTGIAE